MYVEDKYLIVTIVCPISALPSSLLLHDAISCFVVLCSVRSYYCIVSYSI